MACFIFDTNRFIIFVADLATVTHSCGNAEFGQNNSLE